MCLGLGLQVTPTVVNFGPSLEACLSDLAHNGWRNIFFKKKCIISYFPCVTGKASSNVLLARKDLVQPVSRSSLT
jgi:hypothetical protein